MGRRNPWRLRAEAVVDAGDEANRPSPEQARTIRYRLSPAISNPSFLFFRQILMSPESSTND